VTFKMRPFDQACKGTRTSAQEKATARNFRIFRLRGLHAQVSMLSGPRRELAEALVDWELIEMGAKTMAQADQDRWDRIMKKNLKAASNGKCFECGLPINTCECLPF
jgi:hypothetical protein